VKSAWICGGNYGIKCLFNLRFDLSTTVKHSSPEEPLLDHCSLHFYTPEPSSLRRQHNR